MFYVKITNMTNGGPIDYKGIDISKNIPGSQIYDFQNNVCVFINTSSSVPDHPDVHVIQKEEYETFKPSEPAPPNKNVEEELEKLKAENAQFGQELVDFKLDYLSVPCQYHQEYAGWVETKIEEDKANGTV